MPTVDSSGQVHWMGCWRIHPECNKRRLEGFPQEAMDLLEPDPVYHLYLSRRAMRALRTPSQWHMATKNAHHALCGWRIPDDAHSAQERPRDSYFGICDKCKQAAKRAEIARQLARPL